MKERFTPRQKWYKLDNAAKIFPGQNTGRWSNIFRICAVLREDVKPELLEEALKITLPRFPCFKVKMKNGFFWHYFAENENPAPPVMPDIKNPCHRVNFKENDGFLFRVYYFENRVSIDTFHAICDGYGSTVLLCTLLAAYYSLLGEKIPASGFVLDVNKAPADEELEDAFAKNASSKAKYKRTDKFVYHPSGTKLPEHMVNIISGTMSFKELHAITKPLGVTITEYFAAVLLMVHIQKQKREHRIQKEVCIQVPINLRKVFHSDTLRNFTVCLRIKIDPKRGDYSFEELLKQASLQLRLANNKNDLNMMITANLKLEKNPILKMVPLPVKDLGTRISFMITGEQTTTALLSNLGAVNLPEELGRHIERLYLMPGPGIRNPARCAVVTSGDTLAVTFASVHEESDIEKDFFTFLVKQGIHVKIESNKS